MAVTTWFPLCSVSILYSHALPYFLHTRSPETDVSFVTHCKIHHGVESEDGFFLCWPIVWISFEYVQFRKFMLGAQAGTILFCTLCDSEGPRKRAGCGSHAPLWSTPEFFHPRFVIYKHFSKDVARRVLCLSTEPRRCNGEWRYNPHIRNLGTGCSLQASFMLQPF